MAKQMGKPRLSADETGEPRSTTPEGLGIPYDSIQKKTKQNKTCVCGWHSSACLLSLLFLLHSQEESKFTNTQTLTTNYLEIFQNQNVVFPS